MFGLFKKKKKVPSVFPFKVDVHSHLLPGIDDGVKSWEESLMILTEFCELGYEKVITTPHIFQDHYPNSPETILPKLRELKDLVKKEGLPLEVEAAAEYYLDETFLSKLNSEEHLLTFGDNYLLFETPFINKPSFLIDAIFQISAKGYKPVLAHPERYNYMYDDKHIIDELLSRNVLMQININSLAGYYSKQSKKFAEKLIDAGAVSFIGSDCHNLRHLGVIKEAVGTNYFAKLESLTLLNNTL